MLSAANRAAPASERPKYGGLNVLRRPAGACPGFGSCHLRLRPEVNERTTVLLGDSARLGPVDYIEAHVHGPVELARDAEAVVVDPAFAGTPIADALLALGLPAEWHHGFVLAVEDIPVEPLGELRWQAFCAGGRAREHARRLGMSLDAVAIGRAAAVDGYTDALKDLWAMTVALGRGRGEI